MATQNMVRPGVEIQQEFAALTSSQSNPQLETVIVGLNRQLVTDRLAGAYDGALLTLAYPLLELGADLDTASVSVVLKNVDLVVFNSGTDTATVSADTATDSGANFTTSGVATGDKFVATDGSLTYTANVLAVTSATQVKLDRNLPFATCTYVILRRVPNYTLPGADYTATVNDLTLDATISTTYSTLTAPVFAAQVYVSYKAVRQLLANRVTTITAATLEGILGTISVDNPLALGASLALSNTITSIKVVATEDETALAFAEALSVLSTKDVYSICLLTDSVATVSLLKAHVDQLAAPVKSRFRAGIFSLPHPLEKTMIVATEVAQIRRASSVLTLTHPVAAFSGVVLVGDYVVVTARTASPSTTNPSLREGIYRVVDVVNNGTLQLANFKYTGSNGNYAQGAAVSVDFTAESVDFSVVRVLDKDGQAEAVALIAQSFGSRRMVYITNAEVVASINGTDTVVPGFYGAAVVAGAVSGNQPHQGFTNFGFSGLSGVRYGSDYWSEEQLGLIGGSGGFVLETVTEGALPTAYFQTTTDNSSVETREFSITRTFDYYSLGLRDTLKPLIGKFNIYAGTLAQIANKVEGWHQFLKSQNFPQIGSPLLDGKLTSLEQNAASPDQVDIITDIVVPAPLNRIRARVRLSL